MAAALAFSAQTSFRASGLTCRRSTRTRGGFWRRCSFRPARASPTQSTRRSERCRKKTVGRSEEHTSELQSLMRISYAVFCLKKTHEKTNKQPTTKQNNKNRRRSRKDTK